MRVETDRLVLRPIEPDDVDSLVEMDGFAEVREAVDPFGEHIPQDIDARRAYEEGLVGREGFLAAVERGTARVLGWFQLEAVPDRPGDVELGYRLRPEAWGRGFATEGARALLDVALARGDVRRVFGHALTANSASVRVMQKAGMVYAGPWEYRGLPGVEYEARSR
jgi:RimJ/RimL family protein N-acetyltransferase